MDELEPSELGTYSYWQETYTKEICNFDKHGDPGEVWFGEDSVSRVIEWISHNITNKSARIVDIGCGNGYSLTELAKEGYTHLTGVDYCKEAIELAEKVSKQEFPFIKFKVYNILDDDCLEKYDVVHDKGTYDAISLSPTGPRRQRLKYIDSVYQMLEDDGLFVITSCNWTEQELINQFVDKFRLKHAIPTPQFKFGGNVGSVVSSLVFEKKLKA